MRKQIIDSITMTIGRMTRTLATLMIVPALTLAIALGTALDPAAISRPLLALIVLLPLASLAAAAIALGEMPALALLRSRKNKK